MITNQKELRKLFWQEHPQLEHLRRRTVKYGDHKDYPTDVRVSFVDWLDRLHRDGRVSDRLVNNATL